MNICLGNTEPTGLQQRSIGILQIDTQVAGQVYHGIDSDTLADKFLFHTYGANPVSCAAGRAVLRVIAAEKLQDNARVVGAALLAELGKLAERHPVIGDVRGRGLMIAIELVKDRGTKEPDPETTARVFEATRREGLVVSKSGPHRSVIRMVPPLCLSMADVAAVADKMERCFAAV